MLKSFRILGFLEGLSLLVLLFVAMPMKYLMDEPLAVRITGSIHGFLFMAFVAASLAVKDKLDWPMKRVVMSWILVSIPFGPMLFKKPLFEGTDQPDA